mmetsp:Transcript_24897/g.62242  ORF Transcript_24897/g.62242 Transcript_24897/m.62242 type:complete len:186 (+) Transcript_24897:661-1218(+)
MKPNKVAAVKGKPRNPASKARGIAGKQALGKKAAVGIAIPETSEAGEALLSDQYGNNTPRSGRAESSNVWKSIKRMRNHTAMLTSNGGFTHVCIAKSGEQTCWRKLKLGRQTGGSWITSNAIFHLQNTHPDHLVSIEKRKREEDALAERIETLQLVSTEGDPLQKKRLKTIDFSNPRMLLLIHLR